MIAICLRFGHSTKNDGHCPSLDAPLRLQRENSAKAAWVPHGSNAQRHLSEFRSTISKNLCRYNRTSRYYSHLEPIQSFMHLIRHLYILPDKAIGRFFITKNYFRDVGKLYTDE